MELDSFFLLGEGTAVVFGVPSVCQVGEIIEIAHFGKPNNQLNQT